MRNDAKLERIAVVTPFILPVPAIRGGAVEELITAIIYANERSPQYYIDLYTIYDEGLLGVQLNYTNIRMIRQKCYIKLIDKVLDKLFRVFRCTKSIRLFDRVITKKVSQTKYDKIIIENISSLYREMLKKEPSGKKYFHIHNNIDMYRAPEDFKVMQQQEDVIWAASQYLKNSIELLLPNLRTELFLNGVNRQRFAPELCLEKQHSRKKWEIEQDRFVFLFSGRIIPEKGVLELLHAFEKVCVKYPHSILMIVGKALFESDKITPYQRMVQEMARALSNVIFTGFVPPNQMPEVYSCADVVVVPSKWEEPFGMVALEAMSMGIPLIVSAKGGLSEIVDDKCAIQVAVTEEFDKALVTAMEKVLGESGLISAMSDAAIDRMKNILQFDDKFYFNRFCELLNQ